MTTQNVQFSDSSKTTIIAVFSCPQDAKDYPNQGTIDSSDAKFVAFTNPSQTPQGIINGLIAQVQTYIDSVAIKAGYDSANSCISYMNSTNPTWKAAAVAMNAWRDAVWTFAFNEKSLIVAGTLPVPTQAQLVAALPESPW